MQEIEKFIKETYDIDLKNIALRKDVYIIDSSDGKKVLKKTGLPLERLNFIHCAKEHLYNNGFTNIDRNMCTNEGKPYMIFNDEVYVMSEFIEGKECNFNERKDVIESARALAFLHKCSKGFKPVDEWSRYDYLGRLPAYYRKRLDEIKKLKKIARRGRNKFDYMFLNCVDAFYNTGEDVISKLYQSKYENIVNRYRKEGILCHHDYAHHNIIFSSEGVNIINFDYCCFDLKVYDVANLIKRKMRKCNWNFEEAGIILNEYRSIEPIDDDEFFILKLMLQFPQKFWRVVNKYYNSKRSWAEMNYTYRLQEVLDEVEESSKLIDKFDNLK